MLPILMFLLTLFVINCYAFNLDSGAKCQAASRESTSDWKRRCKVGFKNIIEHGPMRKFGSQLNTDCLPVLDGLPPKILFSGLWHVSLYRTLPERQVSVF